jgi:hypothetical protein
MSPSVRFLSFGDKKAHTFKGIEAIHMPLVNDETLSGLFVREMTRRGTGIGSGLRN